MGRHDTLSGIPRLTRPALAGLLAAAVLIGLGVLTARDARTTGGDDAGVPAFPPQATAPA